MSGLRRFALRLLNLLRPGRAERNLAREVAAHLAVLEDEFQRRGMAPDDARLAARRAFGGVEQAKELHRDTRSFIWLDDARRDLAYAVRALTRTPSFTATAVLTLAVGIGATTAIFAILYGVLLRPLPIVNDTRVVAVFQTTPRLQSWREAVSGVRFEQWRARATVFSAMAATSRTPFDLMLDGVAERVDGELVSGGFFELVDTPALLGRALTSRDELEPGDAVPCVISEALWRRRFGSDPFVIGKPLVGTGLSMTIVGVMPDAFARWRDPVAIWAPYRFTPSLLSADVLEGDGYRVLSVFARLRPTVTIEQARTAMETLDAQVSEALNGQADGREGVNLVSVREATVDPTLRRSLWLLGAMTLLVLTLVLANVVSLLVVRNTRRRREVAIRRTLGASPARLVRQLTTETALLVGIGGLFGVLVANWTVPLLVSLAPVDVGRTALVAIDQPVLTFSVLITLIVVAVVGLLPALGAGRDVTADLRLGAGSTPATGKLQGQALLVFGQTALAMPVLVAAALVVTSFARLQAIDPGFDPRPVLTMTVNLPAASYGTPSSAGAFYDRIVERVEALPGVEAAAIGHNPVQYLAPTERQTIPGVSITIEGGRRFSNGQPESALFTPGRRRVTPGYFEAVGLPFVAGRHFTNADRLGAAPVALVNETMARMHWPGESPIGKRVNFENVRPGRPLAEPWTEIVGVVGDARQHRFDVPPRPEIYTPLAQTTYAAGSLSLVVRSVTPPADLVPTVRRAVQELDPTVSVFDVRTMTSIIQQATATPRYTTTLLGLFAAIGLALAAIGIHGLGACIAARRTREIGVRIALGATRRDVLRLMVVQGLRPAALGLLVGGIAAAAGTHLLTSLLYNVEPSNPAAFAGATLILLLVALAASYLPALRATRVDPVVALRAD